MKVSLAKRFLTLTAATAALTMILAGCGGDKPQPTSTGTEPADGFSADWQGSYPMPDKDKAYNNPQPASNIKDGGSLTLPSTYTPNWNYFSSDGNTTYMANMWTWYMPQLYTMDLKGNITWNPDYITNVTVATTDPLVIKFEINPKAKWNDGSEIDWTAFKATWEVSNGSNEEYNPPSTEGWQDIESITAGKDAKEAVVTFSKPFFPWESVFGGLYNPKATDPKTFTEGWVDNPHNEWAAGPYKVTQATKDQVVFERNENWWGAKPKLDTITYRFMEDTASLNAFKNGEVDAVSFSTNNSLQTVKGTKDSQIRLGYSTNTNVFMYNGKADPLTDINVRKAITFALDTKTLTEIHFQGLNWTASAPGSELFPVFQAGYEDNRPEEARSLNVAGAKKALEASGYTLGKDGYYAKDGKVLNITYTYFGDSSVQTAIAKAYQQMMKTAGIKITINNLDGSKFAETLTGGNFEVMPMAWSAPSPYSQVNVSQLYGSKSDSNFTGLGNAEIDKLAAVPGTIEDQLKAVAAANKAEKAALALYGTVPFDTPPAFYAVKKGLANYGPDGFQSLDPLLVGWQK